jgi:hypothetical protein
MQYDSPYNVTSIIPRGIAKVFTWSGSAGDVIVAGVAFVAGASPFPAEFDLYLPNGTRLDSNSCDNGCKLDTTGTYYAVLRDSLAYIPVGVKAQINTPIELNVDQIYEIQTAISPVVPALFAATLSSGSLVSFTGGHAFVKKQDMTSLECDSGDFCIAPSAGTYYFRVLDAQGFGVGSKFKISTSAIPLVLNSPTSLGIAIPSWTKQIFSFTGAAGDAIAPQKFGLDIRDIYKSDGTGLRCTVLCKLPVSGTYYLVARSNTNRFASDQVLISKAEPYSVGTVFSSTSESEFQSFHRFYATTGQRMTLASSKTAGVYSIPNTGWNYQNICTTRNSSATCTFTDAGYYYVYLGNDGSTIPSGTTFSLTAA